MYALSLVINTVTHITAHTMFAYILLVIKWTAALLAMAMACAFWLFAGARRAFGPLKVAWDMDDCLIKSHRLEKLASQTSTGNEKDAALRETVTAMPCDRVAALGAVWRLMARGDLVFDPRLAVGFDTRLRVS